MGPEIFSSSIAAVASLLTATVIFLAGVYMMEKSPWLRRKLKRLEMARPNTSRLAELTDSLKMASGEVDEILEQLAQVAQQREATVRVLETNLQSLGVREKKLKEQVEALEKTPIQVAEYFGKLVQKEQRRSAMRDYLLFATGVFVTSGITLIVAFLRR